MKDNVLEFSLAEDKGVRVQGGKEHTRNATGGGEIRRFLPSTRFVDKVKMMLTRVSQLIPNVSIICFSAVHG